MKDTGPRYYGRDGVGRKKNKPSERGAMRWRAGKARCMAITTTCVSSLEDDNECMVYVSYIVAWARPLQIKSGNQIAAKQLLPWSHKMY